MAFYIPTAQEWLQRAREAFRAYLPATDAWLWPNNINPTAKVLGGLAHGLGGFIDYVQKQAFAITADREHLMLMAEDFGIGLLPADAANGSVTIASTAALTVETGAVLARADGAQFETVEGGSTLAAGSLTISVVALTSGKAANTESGTTLTAVSGVATAGTLTITAASEGIKGGHDEEDTESLRERILFRKRFPPRGGSASDYVIWSREVPGCTRAFVEKTWNGGGTIRVFPMFDNTYPNGIAPADEIELARQHLQAEAPAGALVTVVAPLPFPINVQVSGLSPGTTAVHNAALEEIGLAFLRQSRVSGGNAAHPAMPFLATPLIFSRSWLWQAVANAAGEQAHQIAQPVSDIAIPAGYIPVLGTVSFT